MERNNYKIVIIGESKVGKTSIITRYIKNEFSNISLENRTINAYNLEKSLVINENTVKLNIWDTAGEEKYHALTPLYYRDADGVILVFDLTNRDTFQSINRWFDEVKTSAKPELKVVLCGNKCDLPQQVSFDEAHKLGSEQNATYIAVSAKTSVNVADIFSQLALQIYHSRNKKSEINNQKKRKSLRIGDVGEINKKKSGCC